MTAWHGSVTQRVWRYGVTLKLCKPISETLSMKGGIMSWHGNVTRKWRVSIWQQQNGVASACCDKKISNSAAGMAWRKYQHGRLASIGNVMIM